MKVLLSIFLVVIGLSASIQVHGADTGFNIVQPERWERVEMAFFTVGATLPGRLGPDDFVMLEFEQRTKSTAPGSKGLEWVKVMAAPKKAREIWSGTEVSAFALTKRALHIFANNPDYHAHEQFIKDGGMQRWRMRIVSEDRLSASEWHLFYIVSPYAPTQGASSTSQPSSPEPAVEPAPEPQVNEPPTATATKVPRVILKKPRGPDPLRNASVMIEMLSPTAFETFYKRTAYFRLEVHAKVSWAECCNLEFQQSVMHENREFEWTTIMDTYVTKAQLESKGFVMTSYQFYNSSMRTLDSDPAYASYRQMIRDGKNQHWRVRAYTEDGRYKSDWLRFKVRYQGDY